MIYEEKYYIDVLDEITHEYSNKWKIFKDVPWYYEPDELIFMHKPTNILCNIKRTEHSGHLNGYIYLPVYEYFKIHNRTNCLLSIAKDKYIDESTSDIDLDVHGGITFNEYCPETKLQKIGFDTRHAWDLSPEDLSKPYNQITFNATYKNILFVLDQTISLAQQVHDFIKKQKDII